jgi:hypothetical protein
MLTLPRVGKAHVGELDIWSLSQAARAAARSIILISWQEMS